MDYVETTEMVLTVKRDHNINLNRFPGLQCELLLVYLNEGLYIGLNSIIIIMMLNGKVGRKGPR